jgi:acyl-CoA hydrolase
MLAPETPETDLDIARVRAEFQPGGSIYVQGGVGEPLALRGVLASSPEVLADVRLTACLLPQMNEFDYAGLHASARLITFLLPEASRASFAAGRVEVRPLPYSQIAAALAEDPPFDLAILQVTPPDAHGRCSFGPCADFAPIVWPRARRRLAFVNARLPRTPHGPTIPFEALDVAIDATGPFITALELPATPQLAAIGARVAALVPDGAAIQTGIGGAPAVAVRCLANRRGLRVRSGMVTPGYRTLADAGALDPHFLHVTGLALGDEDFMRWAAARFRFEDVRTTHGASALVDTGGLYAINSALEVDLFGQVNLEWRGGRLFSGLGGAPDFTRAARLSGGRAILALPAAGRGASGGSRIVPRLPGPTVSLPRDDTDLVVTEHGVAELTGASLEARAERLIAIASPEHRRGLEEAWAALRRTL